MPRKLLQIAFKGIALGRVFHYFNHIEANIAHNFFLNFERK